jgi:anti-sigma regulatory factor (Ser/Thr protein kinase)
MMRHFGSQEPFLPPQLVSSDLQLLVNEAIDLHRPAAEAAGIRIASVGLSGVIASVDHTQLVRVLMNLLGNAIRASGNGGTIEVSVGIDGQEATIRVVDDGIGMSQEQIDRAFDPGFSTKGDGRGGLGLAISHLIVDAHAGRLALASAIGRGTTATIWLPLGAADALPPGIGPLLLIMADGDKRDRLANWIQSLGGDSVEIGSANELDAVLDEDPRPWSLVVRAPSPSLSPAQRQRLRGFPQTVLGSRRNLLYQTDRCDLSPAMLKRIAEFAAHPDQEQSAR